MGIVTGISRRVEIPHESGEWMEFRKLTWRELEEASEVAGQAGLKRIKGYGPEMLQALRDMGNEQKKQEDSYDKQAILRTGLTAWSYDAPVAPENIDLLDEQTAAWAYEQILSLSKPRTEEEQKNA